MADEVARAIGGGAAGSVSSGQLAREYRFVDVDGSAPDCRRYMVEIMDAGKPPDTDRYR